MDLTQKQQEFVRAYVENSGNGTQAAIRAGYAPDSAHVAASNLLKNPKVQEALKKLRAELEQSIRDAFISDALVARRVLVKILNDPNASNRDKLVAARDVLDRAGFKPTDKTEIYGKDGGSLEITFVEPKR